MDSHKQKEETAQQDSAHDELSRLLTRDFTPTDVLLRGDAMDRLMKFAEAMSKAKVAIPQQFRDNPGDCLAIVLQSALWKLDPFAVARKCYVTPGGVLAYEGQLVSAVIMALAPIKARPDYQFIGDWAKVLGKFTERESAKGNKYFAPAWTDESGVGVMCSCTFIGENEPRTVTLMLSQCHPRNSTLWATDPQQQITYTAIRKWARRYAPDVLLGIYAKEEIEEYEQIDNETGEITRGKAAVKEPQKKKAAAAATEEKKTNEGAAAANGAASANGATSTQTSSSSAGGDEKTIIAGALKIVQAAIDRSEGAVSAQSICEHFKVGSLAELKQADVNGVLKLIQEAH